MAVGKFGPASGICLVDGYNMLSNKITGLREKISSELTDGTGIGDTFTEQYPTGLASLEVVQEGAFFDTTANFSHAAFSGSVPSSPQATARILCVGFAGQTIGYPFVGFEGTYSSEYEVVAELGNLQKANVTYSISGARSAGVILEKLVTKTDSWDTTSTPVDNAASSSAGGVGFIQCTAASGFSGFVGKVRHSADDVTYVDLLLFTDNVTAPFAERVSVSGTVNRYLSFTGIVSGTGSITIFAGFSRS
jgi:hypothetical protein